ncbi:MAG TPA: hypothetical protein PK760_15510, partial [Flavobacteriales bacterium]|nr:hypothetical protein [Flavobacteriales bacterium]
MIDRNRQRDLYGAMVVLTVACALVFSPDAFLPMLARSFMLWWGLGFIALAIIAAWRRQRWSGAACLVAASMVL